MSLIALTVDGFKITEETATGPAADVAVAAGSTATVDLTIGGSRSRILKLLALQSVSGLPTGVALVGFEFPDESTVRLTVLDTTGAGATITAGSVTAKVIAKSL